MDFIYKVLNRNKRRSLLEVLYTPSDADATPRTETIRYSSTALKQATNPGVYIHRLLVRSAPMERWDREVSLKNTIERPVTEEEYNTIIGGQ
jgi:hypothetical protein